MPPVFTPELIQFFESGVSLLVGTRDAALKPACMRAIGARVADPALSEITLFLPKAAAGRTLDNLHDNGQMAVTMSRAIDHRSLQLKGRCVALRDSSAEERSIQEYYIEQYATVLQHVGLPRFLIRHLNWWPSAAATLRVECSFEQTPGPRAGLPLRA